MEKLRQERLICPKHTFCKGILGFEPTSPDFIGHDLNYWAPASQALRNEWKISNIHEIQNIYDRNGAWEISHKI